MTPETLSAFFGWCAVLHLLLLAFSAALLVAARAPIQRLHGRLFGLDEEFLSRAYFRFLANYKILAIVFAVVPWAALKVAW